MTAAEIEDAHRRISIWWERQKLKAVSPASLDGGSGSESVNPVVPVSLVASLAEPAPRDTKDTKITTSQDATATRPQAAPQAQQQELQQATPGNQSGQTDTPPASGEQNAAATIQQPANAPAQPNHEPELANSSNPDTKTTTSQNATATPPQAVPQAQQEQQQASSYGKKRVQGGQTTQNQYQS